MLNNLFCDMDSSWIIIGVLILLLLFNGDNDKCGCGNDGEGFLGGLFEGNGIIIILLIALLFLDI